MTYQIAFVDRDRNYALRLKQALEKRTGGLLKIHYFSKWDQLCRLRGSLHPDLIVAEDPPEFTEALGFSLWNLYELDGSGDKEESLPLQGLDPVILCLWRSDPGQGPGQISRYQDLTAIQEALVTALSFKQGGDRATGEKRIALFLTPFRNLPLSALCQSYAAYRAGEGEKVLYWNRDPFLTMPAPSQGQSWTNLYLALLSQKMSLTLRAKTNEVRDPRGFFYFPPPESAGDGWGISRDDLCLLMAKMGSIYDRLLVEFPGQAFFYENSKIGDLDVFVCLFAGMDNNKLKALLEDYIKREKFPHFIFVGEGDLKEKVKLVRGKGFRAGGIPSFNGELSEWWKELENDLFKGFSRIRERG